MYKIHTAKNVKQLNTPPLPLLSYRNLCIVSIRVIARLDTFATHTEISEIFNLSAPNYYIEKARLVKIKKADIQKIIQEEISKLMVEVEFDPTKPAPEFLKKDQTHAHVPEPVKDFKQRVMTRRRKALMPKDKHGRPAPGYDRAGGPYRPRNLRGTASLGENKLKFTRSQLNNIINKEVDKVLEEMKRTRRFHPTTKMPSTSHHSDPDCLDPLGRPMSIDSYGPGMTSTGEKCAKAELELHFGSTIEGMGATKDMPAYEETINQLLDMLKNRDLNTMALKMSLSPNRHSISKDRLGNVVKSVDRGFPDEEKRTIVQSILSSIGQGGAIDMEVTESMIKKAIREKINTLKLEAGPTPHPSPRASDEEESKEDKAIETFRNLPNKKAKRKKAEKQRKKQKDAYERLRKARKKQGHKR